MSPPVSSLQPSPMESHRRRRNAISSSWIYLKKIFTSKPCTVSLDAQLAAEEVAATVCSGRCSMHSVVSTALPETMSVSDSQRKIPVVTSLESDISADHQFFPLRNDIFPCPACDEIFQKPHILEQHQTLKHAVSEHIDENNIVHNIFKIFQKGWIDTENSPDQENPQQHEKIGEIRGVRRARQIKSGTKQRRPEVQREVHRRRQRAP